MKNEKKESRKNWYRVIAIDMGKTNFGGIFDGTVSSSPRLKSTHFQR
jgi:hypothetical protein